MVLEHDPAITANTTPSQDAKNDADLKQMKESYDLQAYALGETQQLILAMNHKYVHLSLALLTVQKISAICSDEEQLSANEFHFKPRNDASRSF